MQYWIYSNLGFFLTDLNSAEVFESKSSRILIPLHQFLYETIDMIFLVTKSDIIVFSLHEQHYLCWSFLLQNFKTIILSLIITDPPEIDVHKKKFGLREYSTSLKCIKAINNAFSQSFNKRNSHRSIPLEYQNINTFSGIQTAQNLFKQQIEALTLDNESDSTKIMLNNILESLEYWIEQKRWNQIEVLDFLSITLVSLVEITPYDVSPDEDKGQYYTPLDLTFPLIKYTFQSSNILKSIKFKDLLKLRILDPAVGTGMILLVALEWLTNLIIRKSRTQEAPSLIQLRRQINACCLVGIDVDKKMVDYSTKIFLTFLNTPPPFPESLDSILNEDFISNCLRKSDDFENFTFYDVILSNPPFLALHSRFIKIPDEDYQTAGIKELIPNFFGLRDNLYVAFLGLALMHKTRSKDGVVGFVIDRSFLDLPSYKSLRKKLLDSFNISYLLESYKYDHAVVDLAVIIINKSEVRAEKFLSQKAIGETVSLKDYSEFYSNINYSFKTSTHGNLKSLISQIKSSSLFLGAVSKISCGLEYGSLLKTNFLSSEKKKDFYPVLDGANGVPLSYLLYWIPDQKNSYVRFSKDYEDELIQSGRNISAKSGKRVYLISGDKRRFINPKIILRQTAAKFIGCYDEEGYFALRNLHLIYDTRYPYSMKLILGILTSDFGNWIGKELNIIRTGSSTSHRYPQIRIGDLKRFPLVNLETLDKSAIKETEKIVAKVNLNLQTGKLLAQRYTELWEIIHTNGEPIKLSSQKRIFQLVKKPDKLKAIVKNANKEFWERIRVIQILEGKLLRNRKEINKRVLRIYNISTSEWETQFKF
jgi:hypothetical protein